MQIMITNGGPHSHEKWAIATAEQIIQIGASATGTQAMDARKLENKVIEILEGSHKSVQEDERDNLKDDDHLLTEFDASDYIDEPLAQIVEASKGTPFEGHFAKVETQSYLRDLLGTHFRTSMHIERSWHVDRNSDHVHAEAFRQRHSGV